MTKDQLIVKLRAIRSEGRTALPTFNPANWPASVTKALDAAYRNVGSTAPAKDRVRRSFNVVMGLIKRDLLSLPATPAAPGYGFDF